MRERPLSGRIPGLGHLLVGQPEIGERLQRALNLKGQLPEFTEDEYGVSCTVEDLTLPEFRYLRRFNQFHSGLNVAAVAAQQSFTILAPVGGAAAGRQVLTVVDQVILANQTAAVQAFSIGLASFAGFVMTATICNILDDRQRVPATTSQAFNSHNFFNSAAPPPIDRPVIAVVPIGGTVTITGPWIMTNKDNLNPLGLVVSCATINAAAIISLMWRERFLMPSEQ